ncbi:MULTISPECIES: helix-turn-helix transcriptional regulator [unclassified Cupriavidus]|uniref:helix-turn-helix domain-containing protein n=1 Tax=unclassified Cupriavidus TaxID=2640874 RepID=UPI001C004700|nr:MULTISPECIES: helix-turn-helix transcriptional regulator [unclassified Cupriavidus]MCA3182825.1 helix-turn-helix transcriptional regulator [Cupriavidus sp.]MCA3190888.1 helix-turn-helix transcriptional regulator [Cupriavidus sp.]MCA3196495.1 helix-turn-helix transcriptional regulator [Cupriavidus sp.]MCA3205385.1 helix-turn-helix transcriptional regulator [Cupriavidus sp.]MCA3210186.1 helix-turn-helix transcriptional regulator [Cupriavidus sp.]
MATQYPIRILTQLNPVLQGFRKSRGLSQADVAARLGVSQQSYARLEANPGRASMARVLAVLQALEVDLVLSPRGAVVARDTADAGPARRSTARKAVTKAPTKAASLAPRRKPKPGQGSGSGEDW